MIQSFSSLAALFILALATTVSPLRAADTDIPTSNEDKLSAYATKMDSYSLQFHQLGNGVTGLDLTIIASLKAVSERCSIHLLHVRAQLLIQSMVQNDADSARIKPVVSRSIRAFVTDIDRLLKEVNNALAYSKSAAAVAAGNNLKDDLRELKAILEKP